MRYVVLVCALIGALAPEAAGNGRPAATSTINFRADDEQRILAGMTFGALFSDDGGVTWRWICERAVKYGGMYDPDYVYTSTGAIFATTFSGSLVNRDGCVFDATTHGNKVISSIAQGPDGAIYMAAVHPANPTVSDPGDSAIYKSTDNGMTFPSSAAPGMIGDWWSSLEVAPSDAQRLYLSGYRSTQNGRTFHLFKSIDGAASWVPISTSGITTTANSTIKIAGISNLNPDHVYARVTYQLENLVSDGIYRSTNAGETWTLIFTKLDDVAFVVRANGDLVVGTRNEGAFVSRAPANGDGWEPLVGPPRINCLVENRAGEVWACTQNFGNEQFPADEAGIMKTIDLVTWTKVLRYQDIQAPLSCPAGSLQKDECEPMWCGFKRQLVLTSTVIDCPEIDGIPDAPDSTPPTPTGCCETRGAGNGPASLAISLLVALQLRRSRRS